MIDLQAQLTRLVCSADTTVPSLQDFQLALKQAFESFLNKDQAKFWMSGSTRELEETWHHNFCCKDIWNYYPRFWFSFSIFSMFIIVADICLRTYLENKGETNIENHKKSSWAGHSHSAVLVFVCGWPVGKLKWETGRFLVSSSSSVLPWFPLECWMPRHYRNACRSGGQYLQGVLVALSKYASIEGTSTYHVWFSKVQSP